MKKIALVLGSLIILTILGQDVFAEESDFCTHDSFSVIFNYTITEGEILDMCMDRDVKAVILNVNTNSAGTLTIDVPRKAIDPKLGSCSQDDHFFVLVDGKEWDYDEIKNTDRWRRLSISFPSDTEAIEIIGSIVMQTFTCDHVYESHRINIAPLQQVNLGIKPQEIICEKGLELVFKATDGSPACVKPKTAEKLVERGWGNPQHNTLQTKNNTDEIEKIWVEFFPVRCIGFNCSDDFLMDNEIESKNNYSINLFSGFQSFDKKYNWNTKALIRSNIIIDGFMKKHDIHVYDVKFYPTAQSLCEWGECEDKYTLYLKISESDIDKMTQLGYAISTEDALNYLDTKQYWTFIPVQGYSCGDVDCKFIESNSSCPSTLRGYLVKENNELVTPQERFLLEQVEIDYSQCLK